MKKISVTKASLKYNVPIMYIFDALAVDELNMQSDGSLIESEVKDWIQSKIDKVRGRNGK